MPNKYETNARIFPAIITIIPILIFSHFYLYKKAPEFLDSIYFKIIGDISIIAVLIYFVVQMSRYISKKLFQDSIFKNELYFPTTDYLLYSDQKYSAEIKEKIREKIKVDFGLTLLNRFEESKSESEARKRIKEAADLVRNKVKDGRLLLQHNIEYGFVRNLIGGMIISIPFSLFNIFFFIFQKNVLAIVLSVMILLLFLTIYFLKKKILVYFAHNYASILYNEYLS